MKVALITATLVGIVLAVGIGAVTLSGDGGLRRTLTLGGIYSVCEPDNYPVVCFADKAGKDGGIFCVPLSQAGGQCL